MKKAKKILALMLVVILAGMTFLVPVSAATRIDPEDGISAKLEIGFYRFVDKLIVVIGKILNTMIPGMNWTSKWGFTGCTEREGLMKGEETFDTAVTDNSKWSMGYSSASLLEDLPVMSGDYYMAGSLSVGGRNVARIIDDQLVTVYAVSDGVSGTLVHAVIDGYGIARGDVIEIRNRLAEFAEQNNIISINVSVMHQHSGIDTLGLGAPLAKALLTNPAKIIFGAQQNDLVRGTNKEFMENLFTKTVDCVKTAVSTMSEGTLYYGTCEIGDLMFDKRDPQVYDENLNRLRFIPDDESKNEIWVCELAVHCVNLGASSDQLSADYPYYFRNIIKEETDADVVMVEGAELAITTDYSNISVPESDDPSAHLYAYARELADRTEAIGNDEQLAPVMNVTFSEAVITPDNEVIILAARQGLMNITIEKDLLGRYYLITEVGYIELGNTVGIFCAPGELAPEIIYGGAQSAEKSWTGESWDYAPLAETAGTEHIMVYGLCNDQVGYVITDNDFRSLLTENEEIVSASTKAGSQLTEAFEALLATVK